MLDDVMDTQTQARNYVLKNIPLYNAIDIKNVMYNRFIRAIIYVDQSKLGYNIGKYISEYVRIKTINIDPSVGNVISVVSDVYDYLTSDGFMHDNSDTAMVINREFVYKISKYLMWSYYYEQIYTKYNINLDNSQDIFTKLEYLAYMLMQIPINPIGIAPTSTGSTGTNDPTITNVRFASFIPKSQFDNTYQTNVSYYDTSIININNFSIYDDNSIIETYENTDKSSSQDVKSPFDYKYIYASQRHSDPKYSDDQEYPLLNGIRTCINREVEFYHTINTLSYNITNNTDTVYTFIINQINNAYTNSADYLGTISYNITQKYLNQYYGNTNIKDPSVSLSNIQSQILALIIRDVNITLINYINQVFYFWKNSTYSDKDTIPQYIITPRKNDGNILISGNVSTASIDYNSWYSGLKLSSMAAGKTPPDIMTQASITGVFPSDRDQSYIDPMLLRAKEYVGSDANLRPIAGVAYTYQIDFSDPTTYTKKIDFTIESSYFDATTAPIVQGTALQDIYATQINTSLLTIQNDFEQTARNNPVVSDNMKYIYWRDMNMYMTNVSYELTIDLTISMSYYFNTMILNHLPLAIIYYYGNYMTYAMQTQYILGSLNGVNIPSPNLTYDQNQISMLSQNDNPNLFAYKYIPIEDQTYHNPQQNIFSTEPEIQFTNMLRYLGTEARINPRCTLHSYINNYSDVQTMDSNCYSYMLSNDISFVQNYCPLCFKTFEYKRLFIMILQKTLLQPNTISPTMTVHPNNTPLIYQLPQITPTIVDDAYISKYLMHVQPTAIVAQKENLYNSPLYQNYVGYLYRPEDVIYDEVTKQYFTTIMDFVIHRIATIMYRYRDMIQNIIRMDNTTYASYMTSITPTLYQGSLDNSTTINDLTSRYNNFNTYLNTLRISNNNPSAPSNADLFNTQMISAIAIITHTDNNIQNYSQIENMYSKTRVGIVNNNPIYNNESLIYTPAVSFIGSTADLSNGLNIYSLIENVKYIEPQVKYTQNITYSGGNLVRYQMYRGNIVLWNLIQKQNINSYNNYFNNVLDPRLIGNSNTLSSTSINSIPDIFTEIYSMLCQSSNYTITFNPINITGSNIYNSNTIQPYFKRDGTIDYYRYKQTREYPQTINNSYNNTSDDFNSSVCTKAINYCRQLIIFYNMLIARYLKMYFLLDNVMNTPLNNDASYYDFSQNIAEAYLSGALSTINNMQIIPINPESNISTSNSFYYTDTSEYYFVNPITFRNLQKNANDVTLITDYQVFNKSNNYHLQQVFTVNLMSNMMRIIGIHDPKLTISSSSQYILSLSNRTFKVVFNDNFSQYVSIDQAYLIDPANTNTTNNYQIYFYYPGITYISATHEYVFMDNIFKVTNSGIFNKIWYYNPTVSNILYDQYYSPVILQSPNSDSSDSIRFNSFNHINIDVNSSTIIGRSFTNCLVTSPFLFLYNKLNTSVIRNYSHTPHVSIWEDDFRNNTTSKKNEYDTYISLFNTYKYFVGLYNVSDLQSEITSLVQSLSVISSSGTTGSFPDFIKQYDVLLDNIISSISSAYLINNIIYQKQQLLILLNVATVYATQSLNALQQKTVDYVTTINISLAELQKKILYTIDPSGLMNGGQIANVKAAFLTIEYSINDVLNLILGINMKNIITYIQSQVFIPNNIVTITDIEYILKQQFIISVVPDLTGIMINFTQNVNNIFNTAIVDAISFTVIPNNNDTRVFTPSVLWNLNDNKLLNSFTDYRSVIMLILTNIISTITPSDMDPSMFLTITSNQPNFYNTTGVSVTQNLINNVYIESVDNNSVENTYNTIVSMMTNSIQFILNQMANLTVLSRYITSQTSSNGFNRYDFSIVIPQTPSNTNLNEIITESFNDYKQSCIKQPTSNNSGSSSNHSTIHTLQKYVGSDIHKQILKILNSSIPLHAWARYLGYRMIEEVGLIIDGEQIDMQNGDLMLLLHKLQSTSEHERGDNLMLGHIPEMYTISSDPKPSIRLYVQFFLFFCRHYGNSLNLVNMMYSDVKLKLKLRKLSDLFYMESGAVLKKPIKMNIHLLGTYIYLGDDERKTAARIKSESMMDRFISSGDLFYCFKDIKPSMLSTKGHVYNVLRSRYHFDDPCRYLLWKIQIEYPDSQSSDIISWDLANYRIRHDISDLSSSTPMDLQSGVIDLNSKIIDIVKRTLIEFNNKTREEWKDNTYFQILQPYNKCLKSLDSGEYFYGMCLFPSLLQPSGATNLSQINDMSLYFEINKYIVDLMKTKNIRIKINMWECSHNIFVNISGMAALRFYATQ